MIKTEYPYGENHPQDCIVSWTPDEIPIDRSMSIDWTKLGMPDATSVVEEDERSLALTKFDLNKVSLETCLRESGVGISGEEKLVRLKQSSCIRLDFQIYLTLMQKQALGWIPDSWKKRVDGEPVGISFDGTVFQSNGVRFVAFMVWDEQNERWQGCLIHTNSGLGVTALSAVLPSDTDQPKS